MKRTLLLVIFGFTFSLSNIAYGLGNDFQLNEVSSDANSALQATLSMVYADLDKSMQISFQAPLPTQQTRVFGIDDTKSYAGKEAKVLGHLSIEG
jgi:hypothetical protein